MPRFRQHISLLLILGVLSLMMHVGVYHAPEIHDDHTHENAGNSTHPDSETCIAGLVHVQLGVEQHAPIVTWIRVAVISQLAESQGYIRSLTDISGRAPPVGA